MLQKVNAQREHDTDAEARQNRRRMRAGSIKIRNSMTQGCRAADEAVLCQSADAAQQDCRQYTENKKAPDENTGKNADQASEEADDEGLRDVDPHNVVRAAADAFHESDIRHLLPQMALHRGADAQTSNDQGGQAHQCKESRRTVESARKLWVRFRV